MKKAGRRRGTAGRRRHDLAMAQRRERGESTRHRCLGEDGEREKLPGAE
jgi:hypothetical protein